MNALKTPEKRPYQRSGLYAVQNTLKVIGGQENWIDSLGEVGVELKAWQATIIQGRRSEYQGHGTEYY